MDADERLTALKKAYADIILNTAKEAAARIMVSERKALRFQHELSAAKEEALHMLLRLKQMMDSKNSEAEKASFSQQRKIEELEAQLQEAEDIVNDLREELRGVQAELDRASKDKEVTHREHGLREELRGVQAELDRASKDKEVTHREHDLREELRGVQADLDRASKEKEVTHREHDAVTPFKTPAEHRLDISQSKLLPPPELQRESLSVSDTGCSNVNQRNQEQKLYSTLVRMGNNYAGNSDLPSIILRSKEPKLYRNGCTQRIRACERNPLKGELSLSEVTGVKHESVVKDEKEGARICTTPICEPDTLCNTEKNGVVQEDRRVSCWYEVVKSIRKKRTRASRFRKTRNLSCRYQPDQFNRTDLTSDISCWNTPDSAEDSAHSGEDPSKVAQRVSSDTSELGQGCSDAMNGMGDELLSTRQENKECMSMSVVPIGQANLGKVCVPLVNSESKASESTMMIPLQPAADRVIKYTFQRKRKRETFSSSEGNVEETLNISEGNASIIKQNMEEKGNSSLEPENSSLIGESSRDDRGLSQVTGQLMSTSGKKWWQ